jgi:hypothetical protein
MHSRRYKACHSGPFGYVWRSLLRGSSACSPILTAWAAGGVRSCCRRKRAKAGDGTENWRLILEAARALTAAGQSPFTRVSVYEWIWRRYPRSVHDRPSLDPVFQGMVRNAPGGSASSARTPLARVGRGEYVLADAAAVPGGASAGPVPLPVPAPGRPGAVLLAENELRQDTKSIPGQRGTRWSAASRRPRSNSGPSRLGRAFRHLSTRSTSAWPWVCRPPGRCQRAP